MGWTHAKARPSREAVAREVSSETWLEYGAMLMMTKRTVPSA